MSEQSSYRQILRSTSIIGGASIVNVLIGLVRSKVAAVLLGPAGVGLIGLLQNLMQTASSVASLGTSTVGTRQIAEAAASGDLKLVATVRRALLWGTVALALIGASAFWLMREQLAREVLGGEFGGAELGWLAVGVAMSIASGTQVALLNGFRRIGDLARLSTTSAVLSTILGIACLFWLGADGLLGFVLAAPLVNFVVGHWFVRRLDRSASGNISLRALCAQWKTMTTLGFAFMLSGAAGMLGQLAVRVLVENRLGVEALGHFQAAWMISMTYIGFVLSAMGTDYYPRLTAIIRDPDAVKVLVNQQTEVALLLAGPVFVIMMALAPWIIELLYSKAFDESTNILRWQILGDVLKVVSWPTAFILLAAGDGAGYVFCELLASAVLVAVTWVMLPTAGVSAPGIAVLAMYLAYLPSVYRLARKRIGFAYDESAWKLLLTSIAAATLLFALATRHPIPGAIAGVAYGGVLGTLLVVRLRKRTAL